MKTVVMGGMVVSLLVGCGGSDFDENREKWRDRRPEEYVIGTCGTGLAGGCSAVAVSGSTVVASASKLIDPDWTFHDQPTQRDPVEALFDRAETASEDCEFSVSFDAKYGYVSRYFQDCDEEGYGERVACFWPDTSDLTRCTQ